MIEHNEVLVISIRLWFEPCGGKEKCIKNNSLNVIKSLDNRTINLVKS